MSAQIMAINIALHLPVIREQERQRRREVERKKQRDKNLIKLAREVLSLKEYKR